MKNFKATKRALLSSVVSLMLCFTMLLGTTFAWFTDSVTSKNNIITAGNLDIELYYMNDEVTTWTKVDGNTNIFKENTLWEPGHTEVVKFKIANEGTLALKSQLGINVAEETSSVNVENKEFKLSDYIMFGIVDGEQSFTRESAIAAVAGSATKLNVAYNASIDLAPSTEKIVTMVVYMPTTVGNVANAKAGAAVPTIKLGINLFATQATVETDSFGPDYDAGAPWTGGVNTAWYFDDPTATEFVLSSAEDLAGLAALVNGTATAPVTTLSTTEPTPAHDDFKGKTIKLDRDIDLRGIAWTPIGRIGTTSTDFTYAFRGTFDGQNHTISNLEVSAYGWAGVFGIAYQADINNLKVSGVSIRANRMAGAVVGQLYGSINNCHVADADILVTPNAVGDSYDNGDKVGGIVGWIGDNGNNRTLTNCSATGVTLGAYRDVGGIAGYVAKSTTVSGNQADNITITVDQESFNYGYKDSNAGAIYGRTSGTITDENNTQGENIVISATLVKDGLTLKQDGLTGTTTLYRVPSDYEKSTVVVPEGVTNIGGYAFYYNSNVEKIVLSSTVTTLNDRAFRGASASEVVLNEGLTNISYQAFRDALNVQSVVIPSTVTTISKEAFQNSGITSLTIPANVTTLEYGACRDMKNLTTVVIEGNVDIPVYAFRACTNLRTVILTGEDVTFGNGGRGMIFTTKESGDGTAITVYVANETVKERLLAADTAAKDYGGYEIVIGLPEAATPDNLTEKIENDATIMLSSGEYNIPSSVAGKEITFIGTKDTVMNIPVQHFGVNGANLTFTGVTLVSHSAGGFNSGIQHAGTITYNNVTIVGSRSLYGEKEVFNNCTFDLTGAVDYLWTYGAKEVEFNNCTFNTNGKAILIYNEGSDFVTKVTVKGCTFNATASALASGNVAAAIEIDSSLSKNGHYTLVASNNTVDSDFSGEWRVKKSATNNTTVNGVTYNKQADGLYLDDKDNYYIYNANGLISMREMFGTWAADTLAGKSINILTDIDATGKTWTTAVIASGSSNTNGFTFNGNGHTISNLTIVTNPDNKTPGTGLFAMNAGRTTPTTFKDITFDNVTVNGEVHTGILWGQMYGKLVVDNVKVTNSSVTGTCNVGALVARNGDDGVSEITFKNCSVTGTKVEATGTTRTDDKAGASEFLGMALKVGVNGVDLKLTFIGDNVAEGNTLTTADGYQGGGIYTTSAWDTPTWTTPEVVETFANYNVQ